MSSETLARLDDQIDWYDKKSLACQASFKRLKFLVLSLSASLPVLSSLPLSAGSRGVPNWTLGILGAVIAVMEGVQQLNKYQENWILYRSTCETLKHEKYLFNGAAGPYRILDGSETLLAERIESLVSQEHAKWASTQEHISAIAIDKTQRTGAKDS